MLGGAGLALGGFAVWQWLKDNEEEQEPPPPVPKRYKAEVVNRYSHDSAAFTQGLLYDNGFLYESTGKEGQSSLRKVEIKTGNVLQRHTLADELFGEGIALWNDKIYQLTWRNKKGFIYDKDSFAELRTFPIHTEGWGLTHNGTQLIQSDGHSNFLYFLDPENPEKIVKKLPVRSHLGPLRGMNELELVNGEIYANIYGEDRIARISPETGFVLGWINCSSLLTVKERSELYEEVEGEAVFNGIAYDKQGDRLFVTGKNWPWLFEINVVPE